MKLGSCNLVQKFALVFVTLAVLNSIGAATVILSTSTQQADALVINLAGAQRMLSQKMAKEYFLVRAGGSRSTLDTLITSFDKVLAGLRSGDVGLGLPPAKDHAVVEAINTANSTWDQLKLDFHAAESSSADSQSLPRVLAGSNRLLHQMDDIVKMLEKQAQALDPLLPKGPELSNL